MPHGVIHSNNRTTYLYRVSLKCVLRNARGEVLVVKEDGRDWWDLPGGGMDHGETSAAALARELREEVGFTGEFSYRVIAVEDPGILPAIDAYQVRLVFAIVIKNPEFVFTAGADCDEIAFKNPNVFKNSSLKTERRIFEYSAL